MAIGVFGLQVAYKLKRLEVMSTTNTHGWFGGGTNNPGNLSTVDRIDFSNDTGTANIRGSLSLARYCVGATGNSNYGWFGGGNSQAPVVRTSTVDRIDFSNDSSTASVRGPLSSVRYCVGATGNSNYGWFGGGLTGTPGTPLSTVDRIDFSNDSGAVSSRGPFSTQKGFTAATGNSNYGWFAGGMNPSAPTTVFYSTVDRIDFSNDSGTTSTRGPLSITKGLFAATGNSDYGWFGGGYTGAPLSTTTVKTTVERIDFTNDSTATLIRGSLNLTPAVPGQGKSSLAATGNYNYGWFAGGNDAVPTIISLIDRIDFSNDLSTASSRGSLLVVRNRFAATGNSNYGWFGGGNPGPLSSVERINFANDSVTASPRGPLSSARLGSSATSGQARSRSTTIPKTGTYGWFAGGFAPTVSYVDRIDFTNDTSVSVRGNLPLGRGYTAGGGNINYGWFAGSWPAVSSIDRIDYSNDGIQASVRGPLTGGSYRHSFAGNSSYGWFAGGSPFSASSAHQRIDYSNDLLTARRKSAPNSVNDLGAGAAGNANYSWWGTGNGGGNIYSRLDYSNDLDGFLNRGFSNYSNRYEVAQSTVSNKNYGWWGGGQLQTPTYITSVERINFANDLAKTLLRASLNSSNPAVYGRVNAAAAGNSDYGWFTGGEAPFAGDFSLVDRITYVNDTATISPRTLLAQGSRAGHGGTANTNIG